MLPKGDKTPHDWVLPAPSSAEILKKVVRRLAYPVYLRVLNEVLRKRYCAISNLDEDVDQWYWGHRGLEYELLRHRLHNLVSITNKSILIAGCGTGKDVPTWLQYQPDSLVGIDYFDHQRAWETLTQKYSNDTQLSFLQGDLNHLDVVPDMSFDIIGSDAVFEHLQDVPAVLGEFHRVLKPGGVVYATFGPLWYCWAGDHVSGYDANSSGYNHLLLSEGEYRKYLDGVGNFSHSEHDGRTWIYHDLFSYLRPREYIECFQQAGFEKVHVGVVLDPRAVRCLAENPLQREKLLENNDMFDLIITGMSLIFKKVGK